MKNVIAFGAAVCVLGGCSLKSKTEGGTAPLPEVGANIAAPDIASAPTPTPSSPPVSRVPAGLERPASRSAAKAAAATASAPSSGPTLEETMQRKEEDHLLREEVKAMNEACKSNASVAWDWASFAGKLKEQSSHVGANCGQMVDGVTSLCHGGDPDVFASINRNIKTIQCRGGVEMATVELKATTLVLATSIGQKRSGMLGYTRDYVKKNLH